MRLQLIRGQGFGQHDSTYREQGAIRFTAHHVHLQLLLAECYLALCVVWLARQLQRNIAEGDRTPIQSRTAGRQHQHQRNRRRNQGG
jgi:hypothetical protein